MNRHQTLGMFDQLKGKAKKIWGDLTDDDFKRADGQADSLYGIIEKKYGDTKETIKQKLERLREK